MLLRWGIQNYLHSILFSTSAEKKLDESFPMNQFLMKGVNLIGFDETCYYGGIPLYIREDILLRQLECNYIKTNIEVFFV